MKDVTILIPSYNEAKFIEKTILSAVSQAEFVIVSDNCSTDGTQEISKRLTEKFNNILFYEQNKNLGAAKNTEFLYSQVKTKYVMNMGAHDYLAPNYIDELKKILECDKNAVMAYSTFVNVNDDNEIIGEYKVEDLEVGLFSNDSFTRVYTLIEKLTNCSIFFGLCRTKEMKESLDFSPVSAIDHLILTNLASKGNLIQSKNTQFFRRFPTRINNNQEYMKRITNNNDAKYDLSYICKKQFEIINNIETTNIEKKELFIYLSKQIIQKRFARFCISDTVEKLNTLKQSDEKFILYGSGTGADFILEHFSNNIIAIVDKDNSKVNIKKSDLLIQNINYLLFNTEHRIIISVLGNIDILNELLSFGVEYDRIISLNILDTLKN